MNMLFTESQSPMDKILKIAGIAGMIISITTAFYLIFPAGQSKVAVFLASLGIALFLSYLTFAIQDKFAG